MKTISALEGLKLLIWTVLLGLVIWFIFWKQPADNQAMLSATKEYWENKTFKTDSVRVEVDYSKLPIPKYSYTVPPAQVITYIPPTQKPLPIGVIMDDSLIYVIDSLENQVESISKLYLQQFYGASKLIYANLSKDTIRLDLLNTQGAINTLVYPSNFTKFRYQYKDNNLEAEALRRTKAAKDMHGALFGYTGYGFTQKSPIIGLDYSLYKGKLRFGANSFLSIEQSPELNLNAHIGYRIYGRD